MPKPTEEIGWGDRLKRLTDAIEKRLNGSPHVAPYQRFDFGEHHFDGIEIWAVRGQIQHGTILGLNERPYGRSVVRREIIQYHHLSRNQRRAQKLSDIPFEGHTVHRPVDHQWGLWPRQAHGTDQGVVQAVISGDLPNGSKMTGRAGAPPCH